MYKRNDGYGSVNAVQNGFTAYLKRAIHNTRIDYLYKKKNPMQFEVSLGDQELPTAEQLDLESRLAEYDALQWSIRAIKDRERYILLARVIDEKDFEQIGAEIGLTYKGTAAVYYRTLTKLRKLIGGDDDGF